MPNTYTMRDLPLTIGDVIRLEELQETRKIKDIRPFLERFVILPEGQTVDDLPAADIPLLIEGIMKRSGVSDTSLKRSRRG